MASRKLLTFGLVVSSSFLIFALTLTILASGKSLYALGKIISMVFIGLMAFRVSKIVFGIKKSNFITNKQGFVMLAGFALIGTFSTYIGQGFGENIVSQMMFKSGIGLTIISLFFLFASLGVWANKRWLSKSE